MNEFYLFGEKLCFVLRYLDLRVFSKSTNFKIYDIIIDKHTLEVTLSIISLES